MTYLHPKFEIFTTFDTKSDRSLMQWVDHRLIAWKWRLPLISNLILWEQSKHHTSRDRVRACGYQGITTKHIQKRAGAATAQWHVDANCCSNFCAVGLLYRTPNWQEVTSLHKHLLRDAQASGDMMKVSSRQTLTNRPTI